MSHSFALFFIFLLLSSCVSVNVGPRKPTPSKSVRLQEPSSSYRGLKIEGLDRAWRNSSSGVTLGFLSECGESSASLQELQSDSWNSLKSLKVLSQKELEFNSRAALESSVEGGLDGVKVRMQLLVFRKNSCNYILSFVGRPSAQSQELTVFEQFKQGFVVP